MKFKICVVSTVFLFTTIGPSLALATNAKQMENRSRYTMGKFNSLWNYSPLIVQKNGKSEFHSKIFKRLMWIEKTPISLVESSLVFVKNPIEDKGSESFKENSLEAIAHQVNVAFRNKLTLTKNKNVVLLQGKVEQTNRYMVINLQKNKDSFEIVTSSIRLGMYKQLLPEVNQLHLSLLKYDGNFKDKKEVKISSNQKNILDYFFKEAHAAEGINFFELLGSNNTIIPNLPGTSSTNPGPIAGTVGTSLPSSSGSGLAGVLGTGNISTSSGATGGLFGGGNLASSLEGFSNSASSLSSSMVSLNDNLTLVNVNWSDSNMQFGDLNNNLGNLNTTFGTGIATLDSFGTKADKALELGGQFNDRAKDAIDLGNKFSGQIDKGLSTVEDLGKKADRALDIAEDYGKKVDKGLALADKYGADAIKVGNDFNDNLEAANKTLSEASKEASRFNDNWAESNKLLARTTDPNHMAKVALYTAAGAALGGLAINLAIQGAAEGIAFLHELFTHSKQKKMEWSQFQEAMGIWDNQLSELSKLEKLVDGHIAAFDFFNVQNLGNDYNKQLALAMRSMKFDRELFKEKFADQDLSLSCRQTYFNASEELGDKLLEFENILKYSKESTSLLGPNYFCTQLKEMQRRILQAENQMQDIRLKVLVAERQFYDKEAAKRKEQLADINRVNDSAKGAIKDQNKITEKIDRKLEKDKALAEKKWLRDCNNAQNLAGKELKEKYQSERLFIGYFKIKADCKALVKTADLKLYQKDVAQDIAQDLERQIRKEIKVEVNDIVNVELSKEQMSWMSRVHIDAYCYQFAHADESKIPEKCKEYPEMLYSLSLARGYEKAKNAYTQKCQDRYIQSLDRLAQTKVE